MSKQKNHRVTQDAKTLEFIKKAQKVHGDKYDYSEVKYIDNNTKVILIDKEFNTQHLITPGKILLRKTGCTLSNALDKNKYVIGQFVKIHGQKYDYSKVQYISDTSNIIIVCPIHGAFHQTPGGHKSGAGCQKCGNTYSPTTQEIIQQFIEIHGNKYDYSKVLYKSANKNVIITCPIHGDFEKTPSNHKKGSGCLKCDGHYSINEKEFIKKIMIIGGDDYLYDKIQYNKTNSKIILISKKYNTEHLVSAASILYDNIIPELNILNAINKNYYLIQEFRKIHKNYYDYSKIDYKGSNKKIIIICPKHGEFTQSPASHKQGSGCPLCFGKIQMSQNEFIQNAQKTHGKKYDYSNTVYLNSNTKISFICPEHGKIHQLPNNHIKYGCGKCGVKDGHNNQKMGKDKFILKANKIHNNKYDYSLVQYNNYKSNVKIICPEHGEFSKTPASHLNGAGCGKCNNTYMDTEWFIVKAKKVHGDKYDYSKAVFNKKNKNVIIICPAHGEFNQNYQVHLQGNGCKKCNYPNYCSTKKEFVNKANMIHNNKYDYSLFVLPSNLNTKAIIICPKHGKFNQRPISHLAGMGCRKCANIKMTTTMMYPLEDFLKDIKKKYDNKYDLSLISSSYGGLKSKIEVVCPIHGKFSKIAKNFLESGCKKCNGFFMDTDEFIKQSINKHGNKYDYSITQYVNPSTKVKIICPKHGAFEQSPYGHLASKGKCGCPICNGRKDTNSFIKQANKVHDNKYNYAKTIYTNIDNKIIIECPIHGEFEQKAYNHLQGYGCQKCVRPNIFLNNEDFINKANEVHSNKYDYSQSIYINQNTKVKIICKIHGEFKQRAGSHILGVGCPGCNLGYTNKITLNLLQSLPLSLLEPVELLLIIKQAGAFNKLKQSENFQKLLETTDKQKKKEISEALKAEFEKIKDEQDIVESDRDFTEEDLIKSYEEQENKTDEEIVHDFESQLTSQEFIDGIKSFDSNGISNFISEETVKFLIKNRVAKAWNKYMNGDHSILEIFKNQAGGEYYNRIKDEFLHQFNIVQSQPIPEGYSFKKDGKIAEPFLMQKLTAYLLKQNKHLINCSGVGAGKSLAAIYASRVNECKNTLIIGFNSTIDEWAKKIKDYFPDTNVYTKGDYDKIILDPEKWNVVVLNYESFQQKNSSNRLLQLTNNNKFNFVVLDEVQFAKQSQEIDFELKNTTPGFIRRGNIESTLYEIRTKNPDVYVKGMSATPVVTNLTEAKKLLELVTGDEYKDLKTNASIDNALAIHMQLVNNGIRYIPKYDIDIVTELLPVDARPILRNVASAKKGSVVNMEEILLDLKLNSIKHLIRKGVLLYSHYTGEDELIYRIKKFVENLGYSCGIYSGNDKTGKYDFTNKKVDVLIGSSSVNTGLDGIQEVCDHIIPISLPWTYAQFEQLIGRIFRQGSAFHKIKVTIPLLEIKLSEDKIWSWDRDRYNRIMDRRTLADAAVDGIIPNSKINMTPEQLLKRGQESLKKWIQELESGYDEFDFKREKIILPLTPTQTEYVKKKFELGDFSKMNKEWSIQNSKITHNKLNENPEIWYTYHTVMDEKSKLWNEQPYKIIASKIKRTDWVIGDLGCGQNRLRLELPNNKIEAFDHIAIDDSVVSCDISKLPVENEKYDAVVLSLALMGSNYKDYIKEAYRVLKLEQHLYLAEPLKKWEGRIEELVNILEDVGFKCFKPEIGQKFLYLEAVKK